MGIIKGCAKLVGSIVLGTTGIASSVLKGVSDTVGLELGSELFGAVKDASFNGIRNMWDSDDAQEIINQAEEHSYNVEEASRRKMADTAYRAAQIAKKKGDEEIYQKYMDKYYEYKEM